MRMTNSWLGRIGRAIGALLATFALGAVLSACQTTGPDSAASGVQPAAVQTNAPVAAESVDAFYGTWKGSWRRLDNSASGDATVNVRRGSSISPNADFILNGGNLRFAQSPDFANGVLTVDNGTAMQAKWELMEDGSLIITYTRFGNEGVYKLTPAG